MKLSITNGVFGTWELSPLPIFILKLSNLYLYSDTQTESVQMVSKYEKEPYKNIFNAWHDEESFNNTLYHLCKTHILLSQDNDYTLGEFAKSPFHIFPVEILALFRVRDKTQLSYTRPDHFLCKEPTASLPDSNVRVSNDIVKKVESIINARQTEK